MLQSISSPRPEGPSTPHPCRRYSKKAVTLKFLAVTVTLLQLHAVSKLGPKLEFGLERARPPRVYNEPLLMKYLKSLKIRDRNDPQVQVVNRSSSGKIPSQLFHLQVKWVTNRPTNPRSLEPKLENPV
jgi:hypothetical protein